MHARRNQAVAILLLVLGACGDAPSPAEPGTPTLEVSPYRSWLVTGDTLRLHATVRDRDGQIVPDAAVSFTSGAPGQVSVSSDGWVEAREAGSVTITASTAETSGTARLEVWPGGGERVPALAEVDRLLMEFLGRWDVPGAVVGVTYEERLVLLRGYGLADRETGEAMSPDAMFRVASLSKPLAAASILMLVEEGRVSLDDRVFEILDDLEPPGDGEPGARLQEITVRHLVHHIGGWDRSASGDWTWPPYVQDAATALGIPGPPTAEEILRWVVGRPLDFDPGQRYAYSNIGYSALARVVERVTGRTYEEFVRTELLAPAGAARMRVGRSLFEDRFPGEVRYHDSGTTTSVFPGGGTVPWAYGGFSLEARDGQGGWVASAADYLRFVHAVDGRSERPDVLGPEAVEWINTRPEGPAFEGTTTWYSGFSVRPESGGHFWYHRGGLPGTRALLIHRPDGVSYVVLLNSQGSSSGEASSELDSFLGSPLRAVSAWPQHDLFEEHP